MNSILIPHQSNIKNLLSESSHAELQRLDVQETKDEVVLSGSVATFYLKSLAQETIKPHLAKRRLFNRVKVKK